MVSSMVQRVSNASASGFPSTEEVGQPHPSPRTPRFESPQSASPSPASLSPSHREQRQVRHISPEMSSIARKSQGWPDSLLESLHAVLTRIEINHFFFGMVHVLPV